MNLCSKKGAHLLKTSTYVIKWVPISQKHQLMHYKGGPSLNINLHYIDRGPISQKRDEPLFVVHRLMLLRDGHPFYYIS
jgi:hypothetical protein